MKFLRYLALLTGLLTFSSNSQDSRSLIQEMVNAVQSDSLMKYVQTLQSYGTRYEYTTQQEAAGGYILGEFARWGTQGESDWYSFGMVTFSDLDVLPSGGSWVVGTAPGVSATTDRGQTWAYSGSPVSNYLLGVDFVTAGIGLAVGYGGVIIRTTDGGQAWRQQASGVSSDLQDVSYASERLAIAVGNGGVVLRSADGGATWISGNAGTLYEVKAVDSLTMWAVSANGAIVRSADGGLTWSPQVSNTTNILYALDFITPQLGWVVGAGPTVRRTADGGATWSTVTLLPGTAQSLRGVYFRDALQGWCIDYYGVILQTTDGGWTWTKNLDLNSASYWRPYLRKIKGNGSQDLMVCGVYNLILTSTDNGASWVDRTANLPSFLTHTTRNIVATIRGKVAPEKECIMVAHYDSFCSSDVNTAPGANDNASATSAVMEAARIMREYEFESTVKLIAVSAEEVGLLGSAHYAFTARSQNRTITGAVNGDMVGYAATPADANRLSLGYYLSPGRLIDSALVYNQRYGLGINLTVSTQSSSGSDHVPFTVTGYDALYVLSSSADPNYHRPVDTIDKLHPGLLRRAAQLMLAAMAEMARPLRKTTGSQPQFVPTEFTLEQNFPNPFNPGTQFRFGLPRASFVTLKVYNLLGMEMATVIAQPMVAGVHTIEWKPKGLASGVYLYRLQTQSFAETKKLMVLK
jgi:photosystem II stability/assembly factor-like uncharacterized protein